MKALTIILVITANFPAPSWAKEPVYLDELPVGTVLHFTDGNVRVKPATRISESIEGQQDPMLPSCRFKMRERGGSERNVRDVVLNVQKVTSGVGSEFELKGYGGIMITVDHPQIEALWCGLPASATPSSLSEAQSYESGRPKVQDLVAVVERGKKIRLAKILPTEPEGLVVESVESIAARAAGSADRNPSSTRLPIRAR